MPVTLPYNIDLISSAVYNFPAMSKELAPCTFERPIAAPESEIILAEGVPMPVSDSPSFENTQVFFSALSFPIDGKNPPKPFGIQSEREARDWEILGRYLGTGLVLEETGAKYTITRERTRQIVEELVEQSYDAAPEALKEAFPRESLDTKKPWSLHKSMRMSQAHGGKMSEVVEAVLAGKSNKEIQTETGASGEALSCYRNRGVPVPYFREAQGKEYQENLRFLAEGLLDDKQILAVFDDIEKHNRSQVCRTLREAGVLVSLGKAARSEGVFIHKSEPAGCRFLKELGIPVTSVEDHLTDKSGERKTRNYFFVLNNNEKTREAFAHPSFDALRTNPVVVLGRVPDEIPTTNIMRDIAYIPVGKFLRERRISISPNQVKKYLDPDCAVTVFFISGRNGGRLIIRKEDAAALADYLGSKLAS